MDQQKLRTLVFEKTGVRIDVDDPVFALVALNEAVLAEAVERHVALLDEATRELAGQVQSLRPGDAGAAPSRTGAAATATRATQERRTIAIAGAAASLGAVLVLLGQAAFFQPAPVVQAKELSPEQARALADADKLARAVARLDQKTRRLVEAELKKAD